MQRGTPLMQRGKLSLSISSSLLVLSSLLIISSLLILSSLRSYFQLSPA
jgi:hypothetical protein